MKNIFALLACFACFAVNAQLFQATLTSQGWAAGTCCRSGVNYTLTITGKATELEKLVVEGLCIDGRYLIPGQSTPVLTTADNVSRRTFNFSFSSDPRNLMDTFDHATCNDTGKIYLKNKEFLMVESHKRSEPVALP